VISEKIMGNRGSKLPLLFRYLSSTASIKEQRADGYSGSSLDSVRCALVTVKAGFEVYIDAKFSVFTVNFYVYAVKTWRLN
jgi:hypothetical protein